MGWKRNVVALKWDSDLQVSYFKLFYLIVTFDEIAHKLTTEVSHINMNDRKSTFS